jgi:hypothetical protein
MDVGRIQVTALLDQWWLNLLSIGVLVVLEVALRRPGKSRVEEFGQMLAVAFAYVSKMPNLEKDKTNEAPKVGQTGQV